MKVFGNPSCALVFNEHRGARKDAIDLRSGLSPQKSEIGRSRDTLQQAVEPLAMLWPDGASPTMMKLHAREVAQPGC